MLSVMLELIGIQLIGMGLLGEVMSRTYFEGVDMGVFSFIGRHESREATNRKLQDLLGLQPFDHLHENKTAESDERQQLLDNRATISALSDLLRDDIAFYQRHAFRDVA